MSIPVGPQTEPAFAGRRPYNGSMKQEDVNDLIRDIERSVQIRKLLLDRLGRNEEVDLVEEWHEVEQIDLEIANKIRKRPIE